MDQERCLVGLLVLILFVSAGITKWADAYTLSVASSLLVGAAAVITAIRRDGRDH